MLTIAEQQCSVFPRAVISCGSDPPCRGLHCGAEHEQVLPCALEKHTRYFSLLSFLMERFKNTLLLYFVLLWLERWLNS